MFQSSESIRRPSVWGKAYIPDNKVDWCQERHGSGAHIGRPKAWELALRRATRRQQLHLSSANKVTIWNVPESKDTNLEVEHLQKKYHSCAINVPKSSSYYSANVSSIRFANTALQLYGKALTTSQFVEGLCGVIEKKWLAKLKKIFKNMSFGLVFLSFIFGGGVIYNFISESYM